MQRRDEIPPSPHVDSTRSNPTSRRRPATAGPRERSAPRQTHKCPAIARISMPGAVGHLRRTAKRAEVSPITRFQDCGDHGRDRKRKIARASSRHPGQRRSTASTTKQNVANHDAASARGLTLGSPSTLHRTHRHPARAARTRAGPLIHPLPPRRLCRTAVVTTARRHTTPSAREARPQLDEPRRRNRRLIERDGIPCPWSRRLDGH
jgi:hypothetical protein